MVLQLCNFLLKHSTFVWWLKVNTAKPGVDHRPDLLNGQGKFWFVIPPKPQATAEQIAQLCHIPVAMNTSPATNLKVIHAKFFFGSAETGFDDPATEGDTQYPAKRRSIAANDTIAQEVFHFTRANIATDDQCMLLRRFLFGMLARVLAIKQRPFDFPDFWSTPGILDAIALPVLILEHRRITGKVVDLSADVFLARSLSFERASRRLFVWRNNQLGFA